jgi:hypothetical protein
MYLLVVAGSAEYVCASAWPGLVRRDQNMEFASKHLHSEVLLAIRQLNALEGLTCNRQ